MVTYEELAESIDIIARRVARDYPDIDWEDVRQELCIYVLTNANSIKPRSEGGNPERFLTLEAQTYCGKVRAEHLTFTPQYAYRPSDIKLILETAFENSPRSAFVPDDARSPLSTTFNVFDAGSTWSVHDVDPFHEIDSVEIASDVKAAIKQLKPTDREALFDRYVLGIQPGNDSWGRKKLNRAINRLTHKINSYRGRGPDDIQMRKVTSNAGAKVRIGNNYEL